jgi:hypothetical protein
MRINPIETARVETEATRQILRYHAALKVIYHITDKFCSSPKDDGLGELLHRCHELAKEALKGSTKPPNHLCEAEEKYVQ